MGKRIDTVTITIDAAAARKEVDALRKRSEELGKSLAEMKKQLEDPGLSKTSAEWKQLNREYKEAKKEQKELNQLVEQGEQSIKGMNDVLANLSKATYNDLIKQQRILQRTIKNTSPDTKKYAELQTALRAVNGQVDKLKAGWKDHDNQILKTVDRLKSYVLIYAGWNAVIGAIRQVANENLQLSDSLADVQKTTGLAGEQLRMLSRDIDKIDTRTTQAELHELAVTAGQMGISAREDVIGFVKAANQLNVALNELGSEGTLSLAKIAQLTGDVERMGVEKSLIGIGSAINELSMKSSATAEPIVDFMRRLGGIAPQANLTTSDLAALGATADALGQQMEVSGTAMSKFISSVVNNTEDIAFALNMNPDTLQNLVDTGQTIEAVVRVLEQLQLESSTGGAALDEVFKEFGSEGERMTRTVLALANNTEFLREQVRISSNAFAEATSVTDEYNVKNENAAALVARIGNMIREVFVNADYTSGITRMLRWVLELVQNFTSASNAGVAFRSVLLAIGTQLLIVGSGLGKMVKSLFITKDATVSLTQAWHKLGAALKANWLGLALSAVVGIWHAVSKWNKEQKMLQDSIRDLNKELEAERKVLVQVEEKLKEVGGDTKQRAAHIRTINSMYSNYIGYQLDEAAGHEEVAAALRLVNEQLDLKYAKMIYDKRMEKATERFTEQTEDHMSSLLNELSKFPGVGELASTVYKDLLKVIQETPYDKNILTAIRENIPLLEKANFTPITKEVYGLRLAYQQLSDAEANAQAEQEINVEEQEKRVNERKAKLIKIQREQMQDLMKPVENETEEQARERYKRILDYGNNLLLEANREFNEEVAKINREGLADKEYDAEVQKIRNRVVVPLENQINEVRKLYAGDAWGKAFNINGWKTLVDELDKTGTASVKSLVDTYKEMEEATQKYSDVNELNRVFKTNYTNIADMQLYIRSLAQKLEQALNAQGRNTSGGFLKDRADAMRREREQEMKKEFEAAKSALEAYYREQQRIINELYLGQAITKEEHTRRISQSNQEMKRSFVDLYSVILGEAKKYGTDFDKILPGKDLQLLADNLTDFGPAMVDGIKNARANSELEIQNEAIKIREIIEKALLEGDMFGKLETEFRTMLDELSLLTSKFGSEFIAVDESTAKALVSQLVGMADEAYTMTEQELLAEAKKRSKGNETLTAWWSGVDEDQLTLILEKLKVYYDDRLEMQRRYTQRMQREWQQYYKQTGGEAAYEAEKALVEQAKSRQDKIGGTSRSDYHQRLGLVSAEVDNEVKKIDSNMEFLGKAIENRKNEIVGDLMTILKAEEALLSTMTEGTEEYAAQENKIAGIKANISRVIAGDSELQALYGQQLDLQADRNAKMAEGESLLTDIMVSEWERRAEKMSTWTEMMGDYLGDWLSLEYQANQARLRGDEETARELEAQQEESKQNLIKSALNELVELGKVWATEYAMKLMYNSANLAADTTTAAASTGVAVTEASSKLVAGGYAAAGKEIGSKGWVGLATGAAIIAAAVGLAAALKAAIANMFPEAVEGVKDAEASAPKRKLTTGMLTYADGKYPVLGNDGVVYDAEYAGANMKTGVYRGPHYGIFSEKKPEMVIDGNTTQRLVLNYPEVYNGILQLSRTGSMRTYADGNVPEFAAATSAQQQTQMEQMQMTLAATAAAVHALNERLKYPIDAKVDYFGKGGTREAEKRGGRWAKRMRVE